MPGGRPPKPLALKVLDGTFRADRDASTLSSGIAADGTPDKPADLLDQAGLFWDRFVPELVRFGVAKGIDTPQLTSLCVSWGEMERCREAIQALDPRSKKYFRLQHQHAVWKKAFDVLASKFGMTPVDREKLHIDKPKENTGVKRRDRTA
jgi:phage terminase small subunit